MQYLSQILRYCNKYCNMLLEISTIFIKIITMKHGSKILQYFRTSTILLKYFWSSKILLSYLW